MQLRPVITWQIDEVRLVCGTSWLALHYNDDCVLRLRGARQLHNLMVCLHDCNNRTGRCFRGGDFIVRIDEGGVFLVPDNGRGLYDLGLAIGELAEWLTFLCGRPESAWRQGLSARACGSQLRLSCDAVTARLTRAQAVELAALLVAEAEKPAPGKAETMIGTSDHGVRVERFASGTMHITLFGEGVGRFKVRNLSRPQMIALAQEIYRAQGGQPLPVRGPEKAMGCWPADWSGVGGNLGHWSSFPAPEHSLRWVRRDGLFVETGLNFHVTLAELLSRTDRECPAGPDLLLPTDPVPLGVFFEPDAGDSCRTARGA